MSKPKKKFPEELFVHIDGEGDSACFIADDCIEGASDGVPVAVYVLKETRTKVITHTLKTTT